MSPLLQRMPGSKPLTKPTTKWAFASRRSAFLNHLEAAVRLMFHALLRLLISFIAAAAAALATHTTSFVYWASVSSSIFLVWRIYESFICQSAW